jgi:hypothetical protein
MYNQRQSGPVGGAYAAATLRDSCPVRARHYSRACPREESPILQIRDPELVRELESNRPELQTILEYTKETRQSLIVGPGRPEDMQSEDPVTEARMDSIGLSRRNPEAAIAKAEQLPDDDKRASTMLEVSRGMAGDYTERAAELIAETQSKNPPTDDEMQFNLISAQASVAAAQNKKGQYVVRESGGFPYSSLRIEHGKATAA